jgi:4-oxalocrotonate tautomerase
MPHIIVKLYPGRTEEQKKELADELTKTVMKVLNSKETSISVGIEDVSPADWTEKVQKPDIDAKPNTIYKHSAR